MSKFKGFEYRIKKVLKKYKNGMLHSTIDESGADGFWDLAQDIDRHHNNCFACWGKKNTICKQDAIYSEIMELHGVYKNEDIWYKGGKHHG